MIEFPCDRCEQTVTVPDEMAGEKIECPHCADMNRVPSQPGITQDTADPPPDIGPEQDVRLFRRSLPRSHPIACLLLALLPLALPFVVRAVTSGMTAGNLALIGVGAAALSWGALAIWWVATTHTALLRVTNKRTIERRGLLSRSTNEVLHDHVRNIRVEQSLLNRIFDVGSIGISSSGQDGIEIEMRSIPRPRYVKQIIDSYRPL